MISSPSGYDCFSHERNQLFYYGIGFEFDSDDMSFLGGRECFDRKAGARLGEEGQLALDSSLVVVGNLLMGLVAQVEVGCCVAEGLLSGALLESAPSCCGTVRLWPEKARQALVTPVNEQVQRDAEPFPALWEEPRYADFHHADFDAAEDDRGVAELVLVAASSGGIAAFSTLPSLLSVRFVRGGVKLGPEVE